MSAQELRARIQNLASEIDLQKNLLKKLEQDKILAQRQLNAVVDPVSRLPLEISSEIFIQSLAPTPAPGAHHAPMLLLNICTAWTDIALSTPSLWASIRIDFPCAEGTRRLLRIWFRRARHRPLALSLGRDLTYLDSRVFDIIWRNGERLKHVEFSDDDIYDEMEDASGNIDLFAGTTPCALPSLETLTIRCLIGRRGFFAPQILQLLRLAPNINECVFNGEVPAYDDFPTTSENVVHPRLRRLMFGKCEWRPESDAHRILGRLSLPALEALSVPVRAIAGDNLLHAFLKRSAPPLQELVVGDAESEGLMDPIQLHACLDLIPSLARLELWRPDSHLVDNLFAVLADSPSLLPKLHNLTLHMDAHGSAIEESSWKTLLRALPARRVQLEILDVMPPPADVLASFRALVLDGIQIYIGTKECNFVVA